MQTIQIQPVPNQEVSVLLAGQPCLITLRQCSTGLYAELSVNGVLIIGGVLVLNANRIVRGLYLGFVGDLLIYDSVPPANGPADPDYTGLGSRFLLVYLEASDLGGAG